jgi:hypothetical protein
MLSFHFISLLFASKRSSRHTGSSLLEQAGEIAGDSNGSFKSVGSSKSLSLFASLLLILMSCHISFTNRCDVSYCLLFGTFRCNFSASGCPVLFPYAEPRPKRPVHASTPYTQKSPPVLSVLEIKSEPRNFKVLGRTASREICILCFQWLYQPTIVLAASLSPSLAVAAIFQEVPTTPQGFGSFSRSREISSPGYPKSDLTQMPFFIPMVPIMDAQTSNTHTSSLRVHALLTVGFSISPLMSILRRSSVSTALGSSLRVALHSWSESRRFSGLFYRCLRGYNV